MSALDVRDPKFTARLEDALGLLVRQPMVSVKYLTRRYDLPEGDLQAWLDAFNGGSKELTAARLAAVMTEVGVVVAHPGTNGGTPPPPPARVEITIDNGPAGEQERVRKHPAVEKVVAAVVNRRRKAPMGDAPGGRWPWLRKQWIQLRTFKRFYPLAHALAHKADQNTPGFVRGLLRSNGITPAAWDRFRAEYFDGVMIDAKTVEFFRQWAHEKLGDKMPEAFRTPSSGTLADVLPPTKPRRRLTETAAAPAKRGAAVRPCVDRPVAPPAPSTPLLPLLEQARQSLQFEIEQQLNAGLASFRFAVDVRLVPSTGGK